MTNLSGDINDMLKVYGRSNPKCSQCLEAKAYFEANAIPYHYYDISEEPEHREVVINSGQRSLPCIFSEEGTLIGTLDDYKFQEAL